MKFSLIETGRSLLRSGDWPNWGSVRLGNLYRLSRFAGLDHKTCRRVTIAPINHECPVLQLISIVISVLKMNLKIVGVTLTLCLSCMVGSLNAQWYSSADFLIMNRYGNDNPIFQRQAVQTFNRTVDMETTTVTVGPTSTTTETPIRVEEITDDLVGGSVLRADDVDFGHMPGGRLLIGRRFGDFGLEGSWLWTDTWAGEASVSSANGDLVGPFVSEGVLLNRHTYIEHIPTSTVLIDQDSPESAIEHLNSFSQIEHRSKLRTGDLSMTARLMESSISSVTLLTGFRYADLEERFGYNSTSVPVPAGIIATVNSPSQSIQTRNRLFGPQLGLAIDTGIREKLILNLSAKTTLAYNEVDRDLSWSPDITDPTLNVFTSSRRSTASFLGEFSARGAVYLTTNLSIHAGYQVLVLSEVALAADNFNRNINALNNGTSLVNTNSRVVYGSPVFGTTLSF